MENLFKDYYALNTFRSVENKIMICIGCGGTGSAFIRDAARLASVAKEEGQHVKLILCDADTVSENNLKRQCFAPRDIGKNKAGVLAQRYGSTFDIDISFKDDFIESKEDLYKLISDNWMSNAAVYIFSFVDNVKTRLMLHNFYHQYVRVNKAFARLMMIDSGNEKFAGQVVAASSKIAKIDGSTGTARLVSNTTAPDVVEIKRDLLDPANWDKFASELSCEESAVSHPQTMAANTTAANICLNMLHAILFDEIGRLDYNMVTFASNKNAFRLTRLEDLSFEKVELIELDVKEKVTENE